MGAHLRTYFPLQVPQSVFTRAWKWVLSEGRLIVRGEGRSVAQRAAVLVMALICTGCAGESTADVVSAPHVPTVFFLKPALVRLGQEKFVVLAFSESEYGNFYMLESRPGGRLRMSVGGPGGSRILDEFDAVVSASGETVCNVIMPTHASMGDQSSLCRGVEMNQWGIVTAQWTIHWRFDARETGEFPDLVGSFGYLCLFREKGPLRGSIRSTGDNCFLIDASGAIVGFKAIVYPAVGSGRAPDVYRS